MTFFSQKKSPAREVEKESTNLSSDSPEVQQQLDRIADNYRRLDLILSDVENKIQSDDRLSAIDQTIVEVEVEVDGRKKKWRPKRPKAKSQRKSANPKKPK